MQHFWEDLTALSQSYVDSKDSAEGVIDLLSEYVIAELPDLDEDGSNRCCELLVQSEAYQWQLSLSREKVLNWLIKGDVLDRWRIEFIASLFFADPESVQEMPDDDETIDKIMRIIWTFRFTEQELVRKYLLILFGVCTTMQLSIAVLEHSVTTELVLFLLRTIRDHDPLRREALLLLLALNDQYMLHDMRHNANKVFWAIEQAPNRWVRIGSALIVLFNRCSEGDQTLKIFFCKFLYLLFATPVTADLLYTNDLAVLLGIVIRELEDLPLEAVTLREMYLRVLHVILTNSPASQTVPQMASTIMQTLQQTIVCTEDLEEKDRREILRLAERCIDVEWLHWGEVGDEEKKEEVYSANSDSSGTSQTDSHNESFIDIASHFEEHADESESDNSEARDHISVRPPIPPIPPGSAQQPLRAATASPDARRRKPPPPPPRTPRHSSLASLASTDSRSSMDTVEYLRPPPPPQQRKLLRLKKLSEHF